MFLNRKKRPDGKADIQYANEKAWLVFLDSNAAVRPICTLCTWKYICFSPKLFSYSSSQAEAGQGSENFQFKTVVSEWLFWSIRILLTSIFPKSFTVNKAPSKYLAEFNVCSFLCWGIVVANKDCDLAVAVAKNNEMIFFYVSFQGW